MFDCPTSTNTESGGFVVDVVDVDVVPVLLLLPLPLSLPLQLLILEVPTWVARAASRRMDWRCGGARVRHGSARRLISATSAGGGSDRARSTWRTMAPSGASKGATILACSTIAAAL
jgi:hypothetical protein